ncbi:MAG: peptidyl-prolyl cis-trans isomerase, partial [Pseudomonadales bacterium]|nr:peptidyl-prolyl cis-trans isomerase [Pseudomonadales bacterium]
AWWLRSAHTEDMTPQLKEGAIDRLVEGELIYQRGLELGLHKQEDYRKAIRELEVQLKALRRSEMMKRVYNREIAADVQISPEEVRRYFDDHHDRFKRELTLGVLTFNDLPKARETRENLASGVPFEELAGKSGADWQFGPVPWARIPLEWHDVVFALEVGEISDVFEGDRTGVRLFKLIETNAKESVEFRDVEASISRRLRDERTNRAFRSYIMELKQQAEIVRLDTE